MQEFWPFIVIGLATGAVYGLAGIGLVLTYKTSGIFNVGYGAVAALDVFLFYYLHDEQGLAWPLAGFISIFILAPLLGLGLELMARSLEGATETIKVVATVGLILIADAIGSIWHPYYFPTVPPFLPQSTVRILGANVTWEQIILFLFSIVASAVLYWFFRSARVGIVMRGVVDNPDLVSMSGDDPVRVRRLAWIIGTMFCSAAGLMLADSQLLDGMTLSVVVFGAFGAAAIGYFTNLPLTFVGGLFVGVAGALADKYSATLSWVGGIPAALPFIILFVALIVTPRRLLAPMRAVTQMVAARKAYRAPVPIRLGTGVVVLGLLALVPVLQLSHLAVWSVALIDIILFLSLGLLVRQSGQISLCQIAFAAVGAGTFGHFTAAHIPWLLALVFVMLLAIPIGAVIAIPAVRVSGVFLALATLGFGILVADVFYPESYMFGQTTLGLAEPRPDISIGSWNLSTDEGFYYLLLVIVVLVVVTVTAISSGRLGRLLAGMADSPLALETNGATSSVLKVIVFCIAAAMASMAGALTGMLYHFAVGTEFTAFSSLTLVALVVITPIGDPWYAVICAIGYSVIPGYITGVDTSNVLNLIFGLSAVTAVYSVRSGTTPAALRRFADRLGGRKPVLAAAPAEATAPAVAAERLRAALDGGSAAGVSSGRPGGLEVRDLSVRFGGVTAVRGLSLKAPAGAITGLVGPNGAGKTTTFNACSGLNRPSTGHILLHELEVSHDGPAERARKGLGRTFQRPELFNSLSVRQNVATGREAVLAGKNPLTQLIGSRRAHRIVDQATDEALALTGIDRIANTQVGLLPIGQRRLVELARALAGKFDVLLLDEPSSGLDGQETEQFGQLLKAVVRQRGCAILLVEHDMTLVREVCDYLYVLDFGQLIFQGTPEEMHQSEQVRAAYLGDAAVEAAGTAGGTAAVEDLPSVTTGE